MLIKTGIVFGEPVDLPPSIGANRHHMPAGSSSGVRQEYSKSACADAEVAASH